MPRVTLPAAFTNPLLPVRDFSIFSDEFRRPNGAIGSTPRGLAWSTVGASANIVSNAAQLTATVDNARGIATLPGTANGVLTAQLRTEGMYNTTLVFRANGLGDYIFLTSATNTDLTTWRLRKFVGGVESGIATAIAPMANNDTIKVTMNGTTVTIDVNGTQAWTGTISDGSTNVNHGFGVIRTSALGVLWESIKLEELPAA